MNELGNRIREARKKKRMYAKEVAEMIGITQEHYSRIEGGNHRPQLQTLKEICEILELNLLEMCIIGKYPERTIKKLRKELLNERAINISEIIDKLSTLPKQDFELCLLLLDSVSELTQKEKDTIRFILS